MNLDICLRDLKEKIKLNEGDDLKSANFISDLIQKKISFVSVIESLQEILISTDVVIRERGVDFLSWILSEVPPELFNAEEICAIIHFYSDRLKDHHSIVPATIKGLLATVKMKNISNDSIMLFLVPLFNEINCQTQRQPDRYNIYSIVQCLVENHLEVVKTMGFDFVLGVISLVDGETDPSNLLLVFKFLPLFLKVTDLGHLTEEMFNVLSCYFPIDFNASGKNISISREDLAEELMNCLAARDDFFDYCLPLIFEKLASSFQVAKIDSYKLLEKCCATYSVENLSKHSHELWKAIQKDVLPATDRQICEAALAALSEITKLFNSSEKILQAFLDDIIISVKTLFNKVDDTLFQPAICILLAVSRKSSFGTQYVMNHLRSVIRTDVVQTTNHRGVVLHSLLQFFPIMKEFQLGRSTVPENVVMFSEFSIFFINSISVDDNDLKKMALNGILMLVPDFNENLRNRLYSVLLKCCKDEPNDEIRYASLCVLRQLGEITSSEVVQFLETNFQVNSDFTSDVEDFSKSVTAISIVADIENITQYAMPILINVITNSNCFDVGLSNLLSACRRSDDEANEFLKIVYSEFDLIEKLVSWWMEGLSENKVKIDSVRSLAEIIALVVRHQETCIQQSIVDRYVSLLLGKMGNMTEVERSMPDPSDGQQSVILLEGILGPIRPNVKIYNLDKLGTKLIDVAISSSDVWTRTSASRLLASIVNKLETSNSAVVESVCEAVSFTDSTPASDKLNTVDLLSWIVKGLLLANSSFLEPVILKWFGLLSRDDVGARVSEGFHIVLQQEDVYLTMKSHCNFKVLYRQRFFAYFPCLMKILRESNETGKLNCLSALTCLIKGVPKHVFAQYMESIAVIMVQSLDSNVADVITTALEILHTLLQDKEAVLISHAHSLVPHFLKLARYEGIMKIRINALKCLLSYAFYPTTDVVPYKNEVIRNLEPCLDDKKRLVRNEAVRARNRWFLVGAPGEDAVFS